MRRLIEVACLLLLSWLAPVQGDERLEDHPGYVDFEAIEGSGVEANVAIYLRHPLLRLAAEATRHDEPELAEMLADLKLIQLQAFENANSGLSLLQEQVALITERAERDGWEQTVRVREEGEQVYVYLRMAGENVVGLLVIAFESAGEIVFVNIVGKIDPARIGRLGSKLNISPLDSLNIN